MTDVMERTPVDERNKAPLDVLDVLDLQPPAHGWSLVAALIERGSRLREQCKRQYFYGGKSCTAGALYQGMGREPGSYPLHYYERELCQMVREHCGVNLHQMMTPPPVMGTYPSSVLGIIYWLNDQAGWSREQIAAWLRTLDTPQVVPPCGTT